MAVICTGLSAYKAAMANRLRVDAFLGRLWATLADPTRAERAVPLLLVLYAIAWALYGLIAKASQDIHADMAELVMWAHTPALGYLKHPPLAAWVTWLWFSIFPLADWSFYLLAGANAALALWISWRLSRYYLDAQKRLAGLALLMLVPFFNFHALKFNVNTILLPCWAATTLCFLRSFETRSNVWAALAGLCAALSMYGKYWSIFLLAGLAIAALTDQRRNLYLRSAAPWITVAVGVLALAPHLSWMVASDFAPMHYALSVHSSKAGGSAAASAISYLFGILAYVALPVILTFALARPDRATLADMLWPATPERRLVVVAFWAPLLLPPIIAPLAGIEITSLWSMSAWSLLPVVLLSSPRLSMAPAAAARLLGLAVALPLIMVLAAPAVALVIHRKGVTPQNAHGELLAEPVVQAWRDTTSAPLRLVGGDLAMQIAFYAPGTPLAISEWTPTALSPTQLARISRDGVAVVCEAKNQACLGQAAKLAAGVPGVKQREVTVARRFAGSNGPSASYVITTVPPRM
jgi:4-amino-4-deoxy-L-arabinose transferase-like glycosyltransferase